MPWAGEAEFRALSFYRRVVAPTLAGPSPSFWTDFVIQVAHQEPVLRHATLSIGAFFEQSGGHGSKGPATSADTKFALHHYNKTIQQLISSQHSDLDTVVTTCVFLICIEFLRGFPKAGMVHYQHGRNLLASYNSPARLRTIFSYLNYFVLVFPDCLSELLLPIGSEFPSPDGPFETLGDAKEALEGLTCRSLDLAWIRENLHAADTPGAAFYRSEQQLLLSDIELWRHALFSIPFTVVTNSIVVSRQILEARVLVCKVWAADGMRPDAAYEEHEAIFGEIVDIISRAMAGDSRQFVLKMGFAPILHFVTMRCRDGDIRHAAFTLFKKGCCTNPKLVDADLADRVSEKSFADNTRFGLQIRSKEDHKEENFQIPQGLLSNARSPSTSSK